MFSCVLLLREPNESAHNKRQQNECKHTHNARCEPLFESNHIESQQSESKHTERTCVLDGADVD